MITVSLPHTSQGTKPSVLIERTCPIKVCIRTMSKTHDQWGLSSFTTTIAWFGSAGVYLGPAVQNTRHNRHARQETNYGISADREIASNPPYGRVGRECRTM